VKPFPKFLLIISTALGGLAVSLFITCLVWERFIPETAFHCVDDGISLFFWSAHTESAGDKILPGWTWGKLEFVNNLFKLAFFTLWIASVGFPFSGFMRFCFKKKKRDRGRPRQGLQTSAYL
jgi:hypothetical protein